MSVRNGGAFADVPAHDLGAAAARAAFQKDGTVTAGNASGVNDGAAALVLAGESVAQDRGLGGLAVLESVATAALEPELMGYAPVLALQKLFEQTATTPPDIDTIELNETFASQAVAVIRDAKLDPDKTNPYGGRFSRTVPDSRLVGLEARSP